MPGLALLAVAAAAAGDVEGHRYEVTHLYELDVAAGFDNLAGDFVPEHQTGRRRGAASHHVLVAPADIGAHDLEDDTMVAAPVAQRQDREINSP